MKILGAPVGEPTMGKFQKTNAKFQINFKFQWSKFSIQLSIF